jgi:hypothetical protein
MTARINLQEFPVDAQATSRTIQGAMDKNNVPDGYLLYTMKLVPDLEFSEGGAVTICWCLLVLYIHTDGSQILALCDVGGGHVRKNKVKQDLRGIIDYIKSASQALMEIG